MRARRPARGLFVRRFGLRSSLAGRLLAGGIVFTALLIAGVSGFLLVSRSQQTNAGALSNADNRAGVAGELISRVIQPQAQYAATAVASLSSLQMALSGSNPAALVAAEFTGKRIVNLPGLGVVVLNGAGTVLYTSECDSLGSGGAPIHPATSACEAGCDPPRHRRARVDSRRAEGRDDRRVPAIERDDRGKRGPASGMPLGR